MTERCGRCGREAQVESTRFVDWQVSADGVAICPGCRTPSDHHEGGGGSALLTEGADEEILRELDPDGEGRP